MEKFDIEVTVLFSALFLGFSYEDVGIVSERKLDVGPLYNSRSKKSKFPKHYIIISEYQSEVQLQKIE